MNVRFSLRELLLFVAGLCVGLRFFAHRYAELAKSVHEMRERQNQLEIRAEEAERRVDVLWNYASAYDDNIERFGK